MNANIPSTWTSLCAVLTAACVVVLFSGCDSGPEPPPEGPKPDPDLPEAVVDLPSAPPDSALEIQERNDDGTLRVEGVISHRDQYIGEHVEVRGTISEIIGDDCDPSHPNVDSCPRLHLMVRDHPDDDLELRVVGFLDSFLREADLTEDEEFVFEGQFVRQAHDFVDTQGMIDLYAVGDHEVSLDK